MDVLFCDPTQVDEGDLVVFDLASFTVAARYRNTGPEACAAIASMVRRNSPARSVVYSNGPLRFPLEAPLECGIVARGMCNLHGHDIEDGFVLTGGSTIEMNLQAVLRDKHGIPNSVVGLDRKRNFTKPTAECDESDVALQLAAISALVDRSRELIHAALPGCVEVDGKISLRATEAAACLNVSPKTLAYWRSIGDGPTFSRLGVRSIRYRREDLIDYVATRQRANNI